MPTSQTVPVDGATVTVLIPDPPNLIATQLQDVDQGTGTAVTIDCLGLPYTKGTLKVTGPVTVTITNLPPGGDLVLYTRTQSKTPTVTWACEPSLVGVRNAGGSPARPKLTASPDGVATKTDRFAFSAEITSPGAARLVCSLTDPNIS